MTVELHCQDLVEMVTDYLEGVLAPEAEAQIEAHLRECDGCDVYLAQIRLVQQRLGEEEVGEPGTAVRERLLRNFRAWKSTYGADTA